MSYHCHIRLVCLPWLIPFPFWEREDEYTGASWLKKEHGREKLAFLCIVHSQGRAIWLHKRYTSVPTFKWWPAIQHIKLIEPIFQFLERWERDGANIMLDYILLVTYNVTYTTSRRAWLVLTIYFPVNCSQYESRSIAALDTSGCSV